MSKWQKPELASLDIKMTEQGKNIKNDYDEIRVDQNGKYWVSFGSGEDSKPDTSGDIYVDD